MKKTFIYSSIVLLLAAVACNKTDSTVSDEPIRFAFGTGATRALVENLTDLQKETLQVYDVMGATPYYIDETVTFGDGTWNFASGRTYTWRTGTHKFFAYTDGAGTFDDNKLMVSKTLTTANENQVDVLYSDIVSKTKQDGVSITEAVTIPMNHLFAAAGIMVKNATSGYVTVNSVSVPVIKNQGSATVDFSAATTAVTYGETSASGSFATGTLADEQLASNGLADVFAQATADKNTYWLVWPQTIPAEELTVTIEYTVGTGDAAKKYTSEVKLPAEATEWKAGFKYLYTISINPHDIRLDFTVTPWVSNEGTNLIVE